MRALRGISLDIAPGEVVCLLGPSGCGKTTLLRVAAGIEKPSAGRVLINEREMAGPSRFVPPEQRGIGLMFQDFALFPHLSIADNVAFGLKGLPKQEARREAMAMLDLEIDAAVLDANLNGESVGPLAEALRARGTPFVFATGYGERGAPEGFDAPVVRKPYNVHQIVRALAGVVGRT